MVCMCVCVCVLVQGGSLGVLPGHLADHLQRAGASPRPDEGQEELLQHGRSSVCLLLLLMLMSSLLRESPAVFCPTSTRHRRLL